MNTYRLKVKSTNSDRKVVVENAEGTVIGVVNMADAPKADSRSTYSFTHNNGTSYILAQKLQRFWDLNVGKFYLIHDDVTELIKETPGQNLILFRAEGKVDGERLVVKETNDGHLKLLLDKKLIAYIEDKPGYTGPFLELDESLAEDSKLFAVSTLMYFMHKQYLRKTTYLQEVLRDTE